MPGLEVTRTAPRTPAGGVTPPKSPAAISAGPGTPQRGNTAPTLAEGFDLPLPPPPNESPVKRGGMGFGEIDFGGDQRPPNAGGESDEFDQIPVEGGDGSSSKSIETDGPARPVAAATSAPRPSDAGRKAPVAPKRKGLFIVVGVLGSFILVGAGLSFTSLGPFGATAIDEALHGAERRAAAQTAIQGARRLLTQDTFGAARRALRQLDDQIAQTPKEPELVAYAAFANYFVLARFGTDAAIAGRARALYERLPTLRPGTEYVAATQAARELMQGHPERVRRLRSPEPAALDVEVMAAIDSNAPDALDKARTASTSRRSTRTRFLLARAMYISDDRPGALREAESLIAEAPGHAGIRLLAAKIFSTNSERTTRAVELARQVEALGRDASTDEKVEAAVLIGDIEFAADRITPAREAYERALATDPRAPSALIGAGRILYRQRAFSDALAKFTAAATADPNDVDAAIGVGMTFIALGRHAEAQPRLEALSRAHPNDAKVRYWWAKALLAMDNRPAAERELREATRLDDTMLEAYTTLASMLFAAQRPQEAEQVLERARGRVADQSAIHRALGEGRVARGDIAGAEAELRQAVQGRPDDLRTRMLFAQILRRRRNFDEAGRELDHIARSDAEYSGLLQERGLLLQARGDAQGAVSIFRTALARDTNNVELTVNLAAALLSAGALEDADRQVATVVEQNPNLAEGHYVLGRARLGKGNIVDAIRLLERATELDSTRADFRAYAAEANLLRAQFSRATEHAAQAVTLDPTYARGYWIRGEIRVRQHNAREALLDARRALELDPTFADAMVTYAEADSQLGQPAAALELYRRALVIVPDRAEWRSRYARLFADAGRDSDALRELEQACRIGDNLPAPPAWLAEAHRLAGEVAFRSNRRDVARQHYRRFTDLAAPGTTGTEEARRILQELGG
jgi:tetratricopeptide (TPR) repeat protein